MTKLIKVSAIILAMALVFGLTACEGDSDSKPKPSAILKTITIAGVSVATADLPVPIPGADWGDLVITALDANKTIEVNLPIGTSLTAVKVSFSAPGANLSYAVSSSKPENFTVFKSGDSIPLTNRSFLIVKVESTNKSEVNYYRFRIVVASNSTDILTLTIKDKPVAIVSSQHTSTSNWNAMTRSAAASLSSSEANNPDIVVTLNAGATASIQYAKTSNTTETPTFGDSSTFSFIDGDLLYIKITTADGSETRWCRIEVQIGRDASIAAIVFTNQAVTPAKNYNLERLGKPQDSLEAFDDIEPEEIDDVEGKMQFDFIQLPSGAPVKIVITPTDLDATMGVRANDDTTFAALPSNGVITFNTAKGDYLYIKATSGNGNVHLYYKIKIVFLRSTSLLYTENPLSLDFNSIDPAWDDTEWLPINRRNRTEGPDSGAYAALAAAEKTHGRAKLLWDEDGMWVYAQVWEKNETVTDSEHNTGSIELFINEARSAGVVKGSVTGGVNGTQYRVGANNSRSGSPALTVWQNNGKSIARKFTNTQSPDTTSTLKTGYEVMFLAAWRFTNLYPIMNEKLIGVELQINAYDGSARGCVLNWNNENSNSYSSLENYGIGILDTAGKEMKAFAPTITVQPEGENYMPNETVTPLTVDAVTSDTGTLSYQWYSSTADNGTTGKTELTGQTGKSYTPSSATAGTTYYYAIVTNKKTSNNSEKPTTSEIVKVTIKAASDVPDFKLKCDPVLRNEEAKNNNTVLFSIELGEDFDLSKYTTMSIWVKVFDKDNKEVVLTGSEYSICTTRWYTQDGTEVNSADYNVGRPDKPFKGRTIPQAVLDGGSLSRIDIQSGDAFNATGSNSMNLGFMEVSKVYFYP